MAMLGRRSALKNWARIALKVGLLLTDAKLWASINDQVGEHVGDAHDLLKKRYEDTTERLQDARDALRGRSHWVGPAASFVGGVGLGLGIGMLFAPARGEETRGAIRDKAIDITHRVSDMAASGTRFRDSTGTEGD